MAQGQGRSSKQGVKLLYIRDYLYTYTNKEHPKNANHIVEYLASKGIECQGLSQILCKHRNAVQIEQNLFKAEVAQAAAALFSK